MITSLLDTDWYKLTMAQVILHQYPDVKVRYKFICRDRSIHFPEGFDNILIEHISHLSSLNLSSSEKKWLLKQKGMTKYFVDWFSNYRFNPAELNIEVNHGKLEIDIEGSWLTTIFWEVPLMAIISELYFKRQAYNIPPSKMIMSSQCKKYELTIPFADFGTRRRYSFKSQDILVDTMKDWRYFIGTSNPYFAKKYNVPVIGTYAHEAIMVMEAIYGVQDSNKIWIDTWRNIYGNLYSIALADTYTTEFFLKTVDKERLMLIDGLRQDSGDPIKIGELIVNHYEKIGIDPKTKKIVFSDNLNPESATKIYNHFKDKTNPVFGIGTNLTNSYELSHLNMVIKISGVLINGKYYPTTKLSDDPMKRIGNKNILSNLEV